MSMAAGKPPEGGDGVWMRPPPPHDTLWPAAHLPCTPMSQCSVLDCIKKRCVMSCVRDGERMEVARRFCVQHANEYDILRLREGATAPVFDIMTGERL